MAAVWKFWRIGVPVLAFLATAGLIAYFGGNGGSPSTAKDTPVATGNEVEVLIRQMTDSYNAKDVQGYLGFYTDNGLDSRYHLTREEAATILTDIIGIPPVKIVKFTLSKVTEATAEVHVLTGAGKLPSEDVYGLIKDAGVWKIDHYGRFSAARPPGNTAIDVSLKEFSFDFDASLIKDGNVSFKFTDSGLQRHEIVLEKIAPDLNLEEAIKGGKPPAGAEAIGFLGIATPQETKHMVLDGALEPGRYVFLCFMPDADDPAHTPHALKGMHAEFTIN